MQVEFLFLSKCYIFTETYLLQNFAYSARICFLIVITKGDLLKRIQMKSNYCANVHIYVNNTREKRNLRRCDIHICRLLDVLFVF